MRSSGNFQKWRNNAVLLTLSTNYVCATDKTEAEGIRDKDETGMGMGMEETRKVKGKMKHKQLHTRKR